jgi:hypothetical protein
MVLRSLAPLVPLGPLGAALATAACYREAAAPAPPGPVQAEAVDPGWPISLELEMAEQADVLKHRGLAMFSVETRLPVFRTEPPAIGAALNARIARLARPDVDPRTHEGAYTLDCSVGLANRYAVLLDCEELLAQRTHEEAAQAMSSAPADPTRLAIGWWLRRGLPELSLEQLAPHFDLRAAVDAEAASQPPGCDLRSCAFEPRSFVIDGDSILPVATAECPPACDGSIPSIPLEELAPTHAWARELVKRIRRRIDAGDTLVEGERTR